MSEEMIRETGAPAPEEKKEPEPYCKGDCANCPHPCNF